jgi:pimeloyl-ACP methyl ester carboxylesterase
MNRPHTLEIGGHQLVYTEAGRSSAPALVMVHGWTSHRGVWRQTLAAFEDSHHCLALDLLGFGHSDKPPEGDYSIEAQAHRVLCLADALGLGRFHLAGHSMGGQVALLLAARLAPERIVRLIDVAGVASGRLTPAVERDVYRQVALCRAHPWLYPPVRWLARFRWFARRIFPFWFYHPEGVPFETWRLDCQMALQPGMAEPTYRAGQAIHALDLTADLARIQAPTLVLFGRQDGTVPLAEGHLVHERVAGSRLVLLDECGHFPMYEQTAAYLAALRGFLGE